MKVSEVLSTENPQVTEEQVLGRLTKIDWRYEFSDDFRRISSGQRDMEILENMVYEFWKTNPERAVELWNGHCPFVPADKTSTPVFILRRQLEESK